MEAHLCKGKVIRKGKSKICTLCNGVNSTEVTLTEDEIREHNTKILNSYTWSEVKK